MDKLTVTKLKKNLENKDKKELIQEITNLYKRFPQVKEYYQSQGNEARNILEKYQAIIKREFVYGRAAPKLGVARKAVNDFKKLTDSPELLSELKFTYVESISYFCAEYGPDTEKFSDLAENMFMELLNDLKKHNLLDKFEIRAYDVVDNADDGYGYSDNLCIYFEEHYGKFIK
ncbi:hypothetical protein QUF74_05670 [Candidatus Halobeggiatoa sp. HSG11]|nr:hypothetical protein [Candidatus Halobeggiatoa sp. HSG11]